jgi:hypothetical protein
MTRTVDIENRMAHHDSKQKQKQVTESLAKGWSRYKEKDIYILGLQREREK